VGSLKTTQAPASAEGQHASGLPEGAGALARRPSTRVVAALWAATVLAAIAEAALSLVARGNLAHGDLASQLALAVSIASYATLGALIVRRAGIRTWHLPHRGGDQVLTRQPQTPPAHIRLAARIGQRGTGDLRQYAKNGKRPELPDDVSSLALGTPRVRKDLHGD
jgi:hypothetical protein